MCSQESDFSVYSSSKVLAGFMLFACKSLPQSDAWWSNAEEAKSVTFPSFQVIKQS